MPGRPPIRPRRTPTGLPIRRRSCPFRRRRGSQRVSQAANSSGRADHLHPVNPNLGGRVAAGNGPEPPAGLPNRLRLSGNNSPGPAVHPRRARVDPANPLGRARPVNRRRRPRGRDRRRRVSPANNHRPGRPSQDSRPDRHPDGRVVRGRTGIPSRARTHCRAGIPSRALTHPMAPTQRPAWPHRRAATHRRAVTPGRLPPAGPGHPAISSRLGLPSDRRPTDQRARRARHSARRLSGPPLVPPRPVPQPPFRRRIWHPKASPAVR